MLKDVLLSLNEGKQAVNIESTPEFSGIPSARYFQAKYCKSISEFYGDAMCY